jgi:hypothetical protein
MAYSALFVLLGNRISYFLLMGAGALVGGLFFLMDHEDQHMRNTFKQTPCEITNSEVTVDEQVSGGKRGRHVTRTYYAEITYVYMVNGEEIECDVYRSYEMGMTEDEANAVVARYPVGKRTDCWVNPEDPEDAVLTLDSDRRMMYSVAVFGGMLLFAGLAGWIVIDFVLPKADQAARKRLPEPEPEVPGWTSAIPRSPTQV